MKLQLSEIMETLTMRSYSVSCNEIQPIQSGDYVLKTILKKKRDTPKSIRIYQSTGFFGDLHRSRAASSKSYQPTYVIVFVHKKGIYYPYTGINR